MHFSGLLPAMLTNDTQTNSTDQKTTTFEQLFLDEILNDTTSKN
jgi:hypothetical protein